MLVATGSRGDGLWDGGGWSVVGVRMSNQHDRATSSKGKTLLTLMPYDLLLVVTELDVDDDLFQKLFCAL